MARRLVFLLLLLAAASATSAKKLIAFGDSITDNGNGTNKFVQAYYSQLLNQPVTAVSLFLKEGSSHLCTFHMILISHFQQNCLPVCIMHWFCVRECITTHPQTV